jgi:hypothetical protein
MLARTVIAGDGSLEFVLNDAWIASNLHAIKYSLAYKPVIEFAEVNAVKELIDDRQELMGRFIQSITSAQGQEIRLVYVPAESSMQGFTVGRVFNSQGLPSRDAANRSLVECTMHCHQLAVSFQVTEHKLATAQEFISLVQTVFRDLSHRQEQRYGSAEDTRKLMLQIVRYTEVLEECLTSGSSYPLTKYLSTLSLMLRSMQTSLTRETADAAANVLHSALGHLGLNPQTLSR